MGYDFNKIEKKWLERWKAKKTYLVDEDNTKQKFYVLDMFPYPSGSGLHVGHPLGYIASDIYARYKKLQGFNVLHPMGYDSFGLPAEQYAIETGQHPELTTKKNITRYREQLDKIGFSFDWNREIKTSDPSYYRWTQWIFKQFFNSYYCKNLDKAQSIDVLIKHFGNAGNQNINACCDENILSFTASDWNSWDTNKQAEVLLNYRLAFLSDTWVNWCEGLGTVLANDEVKDGYSERGNFPVEQKKMEQWSLRITAYAERLLSDLETLEWTDSIKEIQKNWIGKSSGATVHFYTENSNQKIEVFTTRPDTIYGASFIVLAPEHDLIEDITILQNKNTVHDYCQQAGLKSERDKQSNVKNISGVFTGANVIHPFTGVKIPVWASDYVLASYGTGAIMGVPCGDQRDWDFAKKFNLKIPNIFKNTEVSKSANSDKNVVIVNSDFLNELTAENAINKAIEAIEKKKIGKLEIKYRIRDAVFSRQRYWGEPFPVFYKNGIPHLVQQNSCIKLPLVDKYLPTDKGEPPLARAQKEAWNVFEGDRMEYNTMPGWAGSSWYFLRFMDPHNNTEFVSKEKSNYWSQVDLYVGGAEHAVGHLLYARFWTKFLYDKGFISFQEPFKKLINQGMILGRSSFVYRINETNKFVTFEKRKDYTTSRIHVNIDHVDNNILNIPKFKNWRSEFINAEFVLNEQDQYVCGFEVEKMSKSKHNTQAPDVLIDRYGADTLRLYEMFLGPLEQFKPWDTKGINGVHNFLKKLWRLIHNEENVFTISATRPSEEEYRVLHKCIKKVTSELEKFSFNTVVSALMICVNELTVLRCDKQDIINKFVILLAPYAPHISEEIWERLGNTESIHHQKWPNFDMQYLQETHFDYPVSFNGKMRFTLKLSCDLSKDDIQKQVLSHAKTISYLNAREVKKVIVVPNKIVNIVY